MFTPDTALNHQNSAQQLDAGLAAIDAGQSCIDLSQTINVDSSAVACLLAWKRHALQKGVEVEFQQLQPNLTNLIALYGVGGLL